MQKPPCSCYKNPRADGLRDKKTRRMTMTESESTALHRRRFLKGVVIAGGATIASPAAVQAQAPDKPNGNASPPTAAAKANERETQHKADRLTTEKTGSGFMGAV